MGKLIEGQWHDVWYETNQNKGRFVRKASQHRNWVTVDGTAGPSGEEGFAAEAGRYHLYVSNACPWAHRTLIMRKLKGLEEVISVSIVHPHMLNQGWQFKPYPGSTTDSLFGSDYMHQIYVAADPNYTGRVTVPVLWDKKTGSIVNNESSEIIRMFNAAFSAYTSLEYDFYPDDLRGQIDAINERVYSRVNNGVYKVGFATTQDAYEEAVIQLFDCLDELDNLLSGQRYLVGERLTEADWRLFTTLVRFDPVYVGHFKCNLRRISDYPNLSNYLRELYQVPGVAETVNMDHIKVHYYYSHDTINPTRVVPLGPVMNLDAAHDRQRLAGQGPW